MRYLLQIEIVLIVNTGGESTGESRRNDEVQEGKNKSRTRTRKTKSYTRKSRVLENDYNDQS